MRKVTDINEKKRRIREDHYCKEVEDLLYNIGKLTAEMDDLTSREMRIIPREKRRQFAEEIVEIKGDLTRFQKKIL